MDTPALANPLPADGHLGCFPSGPVGMTLPVLRGHTQAWDYMLTVA